MPRPLILAALVATLGVGSGAAEDTLDRMTADIDRAAAAMGSPRDAVHPALQAAYPGIDVTAHVSCVAENASDAELSALRGDDGGGGIVQTPSDLAAAIAARPDTIDCLALGGLSRLPQ